VVFTDPSTSCLHTLLSGLHRETDSSGDAAGGGRKVSTEVQLDFFHILDSAMFFCNCLQQFVASIFFCNFLQIVLLSFGHWMTKCIYLVVVLHLPRGFSIRAQATTRRRDSSHNLPATKRKDSGIRENISATTNFGLPECSMVVMKPLMSKPPLMRRFLHVEKATTTRRYIKKVQTMANHKSALYGECFKPCKSFLLLSNS